MAEARRCARRVAALLVTVVLAACGPGADRSPAPTPSPAASAAAPATPAGTGAPSGPAGIGSPVTSELVLMTHDSFAVSDDVLAEFEQLAGIDVQILRAGDAGSMVNQAILARSAPLADVLYGVDNTFLSRALEADIFVPHRSALLSDVPAELHVEDDAVTPIDYADVCLNYDRVAFTDELPPPATLEDLAEPAYRGMLVVQNPATSSPGLAFLLATIAHFGEAGEHTWRDYWTDLRANDVVVTSGWEEAYYGAFSGGAGEGDRPIVVSYASSPVAEVVFAPSPQPEEAPTAVVTEGCFRQVEYAAILRGTRAEPEARAFIDFMLSPRFQEDIPLNMFVFPANGSAGLPDAFARHAAAIPEPVRMDPFALGADRERWIEEWTDVVLR